MSQRKVCVRKFVLGYFDFGVKYLQIGYMPKYTQPPPQKKETILLHLHLKLNQVGIIYFVLRFLSHCIMGNTKRS